VQLGGDFRHRQASARQKLMFSLNKWLQERVRKDLKAGGIRARFGLAADESHVRESPTVRPTAGSAPFQSFD
jgi:hypothetical protein